MTISNLRGARREPPGGGVEPSSQRDPGQPGALREREELEARVDAAESNLDHVMRIFEDLEGQMAFMKRLEHSLVQLAKECA